MKQSDKKFEKFPEFETIKKQYILLIDTSSPFVQRIVRLIINLHGALIKILV